MRRAWTDGSVDSRTEAMEGASTREVTIDAAEAAEEAVEREGSEVGGSMMADLRKKCVQ